MKLCREQYRIFWQWYDETEVIILFYNTILMLLRRERPAWACDLGEYIRGSYTYQYHAIPLYRICSQGDNCVDISASEEFEQMIYDAPSKENRKHIFSNILTDLRYSFKIANVLNSVISLPINATESDTESAIRTHLRQYNPTQYTKLEYGFTENSTQKDVLNYIVSYLGLKEHNAKKIYDCSKTMLLSIEYLNKQIEYLSKIYDIDLNTVPDRYKEVNTARPEYSPFSDNADGCVSFISGELKQHKSKHAKLLATIILAMERTGAVDPLCSQTELLDYLARYIPNLPTRQGVSKHIATYKSAVNRSSRSYGGITDGEVEAMEQKIKDFTTKTNS